MSTAAAKGQNIAGVTAIATPGPACLCSSDVKMKQCLGSALLAAYEHADAPVEYLVARVTHGELALSSHNERL